MFKDHFYPKVINLQADYYKLRFTLSFRDIEELLKIRSITVDHTTIQRWVFKITSLIDQNFRKGKLPTGLRWRLDETYIEVNSKWCYLHRAIDKEGKTIDFLLIHGKKKLLIVS